MEKDQIMTPLEKQFFFNAQNKEGNTAMHEAVAKEYQTVTQILEKNGYKVEMDGMSGPSSFYYKISW